MNLFDLCVYKNLNKESGGDVDVSSLVATENKTYNAGTGKAYNPVVVDVPTPPPSLQSLTASHNGYFLPSSGYVGFSEVNVDVALPQNAYLLESQKDDVVTIQNGAEFDMPKLIVSIEPQQDLHGYDSPWVGGAGKNKLPLTVDGIKSANGGSSAWSGNATTINGVTFTILTDSDNNVTGIKVDGTASINTGLKLVDTITNITPYDNCIINGCPSGGSTSKYRIGVASYDSSSAFVKDYNDLGSGVPLTFSQDNVSKFYVSITIYQGYNAQNLVFKPMIRLASVQDATFAPYSNICPISGWTACNVVRTGKNLFDKDSASLNKALGWNTGIEFAENDSWVSGYISVKPSVSYKCNKTISQLFGYDESKTCVAVYYNGEWVTPTSSVVVTSAFTVPSYIKYIRFSRRNTSGASTDVADTQLEIGTQSTTYEPYNGNTYTINFVDGSNPLTVYGGTLDVLSGLLTVDRASVDLGTLNWSYTSSSGRSLFTSNDIADYKHTGSNDIPVNAICECFANVSMDTTFANGQMGMDGDEINHRTIICDNRYSSASDFKTAMNGVQLVYELATPQTYQLTPTQVKSLLGVNNIFADTGEVDAQIWTKEVTS